MQDLIERIKQQRLHKPPLFVSRDGAKRPIPLPKTVTAEELAQSEALLGFTLPPLLRELYLQVGNGGFGPNGGLLGITQAGWKDEYGETALSLYLKTEPPHSNNTAYLKLLPIFKTGGPLDYFYLDCSTEEGQVVPYPIAPYQKAPTLEETLEIWLASDTTFKLPDEYYKEDGSARQHFELGENIFEGFPELDND